MRQLSTALLNQIFSQNSDDPFLMLLTLEHASFDSTIHLVNNQENITSRGTEYMAFPMKITMPVDDGDTTRQVMVEFDNVSQDLIDEFRSVTDHIDVTLEMVLASNPDFVEIELGELKLQDVTYNKSTIQARLFMDDFLNTGLSSERYTPTNFPGIFS